MEIENLKTKEDFKKCLTKKVRMNSIKKDILNIHQRYLMLDPKIKKVESFNVKVTEELIFKKRQRDLMNLKERTQNLTNIAVNNIYIKKP